MKNNYTDAIVAYIGTIWDDIQGMDEEEIRSLVIDDMKLMDDEEKAFTISHLDEIVEEAVKEIYR